MQCEKKKEKNLAGAENSELIHLIGNFSPKRNFNVLILLAEQKFIGD